MRITDEMLYESAPKAAQLWLDSFPPESDIPQHKFSRRFERKMRKLVRDQRRPESIRRTISRLKRVVAIIAIVFVVSFSGLMTVEAYRAKFIEFVSEIFYDLTHFSFTSSWGGDSELGELEFGYLPSGMEESTHFIFSESNTQTYIFCDDEGNQLQIEQQLVTSSTTYDLIVDTEDAEVSFVDLNGIDATLVNKDGSITLIWTDDPYTYFICGAIPESEVIKVAKAMNTM